MFQWLAYYHFFLISIVNIRENFCIKSFFLRNTKSVSHGLLLNNNLKEFQKTSQKNIRGRFLLSKFWWQLSASIFIEKLVLSLFSWKFSIFLLIFNFFFFHEGIKRGYSLETLISISKISGESIILKVLKF